VIFITSQSCGTMFENHRSRPILFLIQFPPLHEWKICFQLSCFLIHVQDLIQSTFTSPTFSWPGISLYIPIFKQKPKQNEQQQKYPATYCPLLYSWVLIHVYLIILKITVWRVLLFWFLKRLHNTQGHITCRWQNWIFKPRLILCFI